MKESVSWDPSLIKKFSSSNHYKLLNQLRNEVKKYPLNKKKNTTSIPLRKLLAIKIKQIYQQYKIVPTLIVLIKVLKSIVINQL